MGHVLVVDDMVVMRRIVAAIVKGEGHTVAEACNGGEAVEMLRSNKFDLVISDWNMPKVTGGDMVRAIRSDPALKDTPVVMVTAEAERSRIMELAQIGVNGYIVKPFKPETLVKVLKKVLK